MLGYYAITAMDNYLIISIVLIILLSSGLRRNVPNSKLLKWFKKSPVLILILNHTDKWFKNKGFWLLHDG